MGIYILVLSGEPGHLKYDRVMRFAAKFTFLAAASSLLALALALALAPSASAHAVFVAATPAKNSIIHKMPSSVAIRFDDKIIEIAGKHNNVLSVTDSKGQLISTGFAKVLGNTLLTAIKSGAAKGRVTVSWRAISDDGHPVTGIIFFTYR